MSAHDIHADRFERPRDVPIRSPRVAVVADDEVRTRRLLVALARDGLSAGTRATRVEELLGGLPREHPDVVVLRCEAIRPQGLDAIARVLELRAVKAVLVVPSATVGDVREAVDAGADGVVLESALEASLAPSVVAVAAGQLVLPRVGRAEVPAPVLSPREKQVLALVVMGFGNAEIARRLHVVETTVKSHLSSAFRKLGVRSRGEACARILDPKTGFGFGILGLTERARDSMDAIT